MVSPVLRLAYIPYWQSPLPDQVVGQLRELPQVEPRDGSVLAPKDERLTAHLPVRLAHCLLQRGSDWQQRHLCG
jgi:hypothetical protein